MSSEDFQNEIERKKDSLRGIIITLRGIQQLDKRQEASSKVPLDVVFSCLQVPDAEMERLSLQVLEEILRFVTPETLLEHHLGAIISAIENGSENVQLFALAQVKRLTESSHNVAKLENTGLFQRLLALFSQESAEIATATITIFHQIAAQEYGLSMLFKQEYISQFRDLFDGSISKFRVFSLFSKICLISEEALSKCKFSGIFSNLSADLNSEDPLIQLNALELCIDLMQNSSSGRFLEDLGVFDLTSTFLDAQEDSDLVQTMCACKALSFFCETSKLSDIDFLAFGRKHKLFLRLKQMAYYDGNSDLQEASLIGIGVICSTLRGLEILASEKVESPGHMAKKQKKLPIGEDTLLFALVDVATRDPHARQDLQVIYLQALTMIFEVRNADPQEASHGLLEKLFESLEFLYEEDKRPSAPPMLLKLAKEPKELIRYAAFGMMQALTNHAWGKKKIVSTAGLLERLLDRSVEPEKLGKEWKFAILQGLGTELNIHHDLNERIKRYLREGPFYQGSMTAVEGMSL